MLSQADRDLFRQAINGVTPLKQTASANRVVRPSAQRASPEQLQKRRAQAAGQPPKPAILLSDDYTTAATHHDDSWFIRTGHDPRIVRDLKRGKRHSQATLDLHGATTDQARDQLDRFIAYALAQGIRCVRIVHGKGYGSRQSGPVLKHTVRRWLTQYQTVLAYTESPEHQGGSGAVHVLLKKSAGTEPSLASKLGMP